jgi:hypothetical protein
MWDRILTQAFIGTHMYCVCVLYSKYLGKTCEGSVEHKSAKELVREGLGYTVMDYTV